MRVRDGRSLRAYAVWMQPTQPIGNDQKNDHGDGERDAPGQRPYGAFLVASVPHQEKQARGE